MTDPVEFIVKKLPYDLSSHGGRRWRRRVPLEEFNRRVAGQSPGDIMNIIPEQLSPAPAVAA
jgi:hypothetical protein